MSGLTEEKLDEFIKAGKPIAGASDGDGLTFRLTRAGTALWVLRYRHKGTQRSLPLGKYPALSVKQARVKARAARVEVDKGKDVVGELKKAKAQASVAGTFRQFAEQHLESARKTLAPKTV